MDLETLRHATCVGVHICSHTNTRAYLYTSPNPHQYTLAHACTHRGAHMVPLKTACSPGCHLAWLTGARSFQSGHLAASPPHIPDYLSPPHRLNSLPCYPLTSLPLTSLPSHLSLHHLPTLPSHLFALLLPHHLIDDLTASHTHLFIPSLSHPSPLQFSTTQKSISSTLPPTASPHHLTLTSSSFSSLHRLTTSSSHRLISSLLASSLPYLLPHYLIFSLPHRSPPHYFTFSTSLPHHLTSSSLTFLHLISSPHLVFSPLTTSASSPHHPTSLPPPGFLKTAHLGTGS